MDNNLGSSDCTDRLRPLKIEGLPIHATVLLLTNLFVLKELPNPLGQLRNILAMQQPRRT